MRHGFWNHQIFVGSRVQYNNNKTTKLRFTDKLIGDLLVNVGFYLQKAINAENGSTPWRYYGKMSE